MRNKIAGESLFNIRIGGVEFERIKYYTPVSTLEKALLENTAFKVLLEKNRGIYIAYPDENSKLFAMKFQSGKDEIPFMKAIDNVTLQDDFIIVGIDENCKEYFMPVF